ncbi:MAG: glycosyltransferase [Glaciimonas sp.]|nr:glycosyltransferase [Glaciimonas sp.]
METSTKMSLVSIHIITYNQVKFIHETIQSALIQDYENSEIVIADDGSTDGTREIILEYAKKFPEKIIPLVGGPNLGITGNSNRGLIACRGKYVAFMGGDDSFLPGKIAKQVEWLDANENRVLCYHDIDVYDSETGKTLYLWSEKYRSREGNAKTIIKHGTFFGATSVMIRRQPHLLFNEKIPTASDWFMWFEILENQSGLIGYVDGVYARYRRHTNNITLTGGHHLHDALATLAAIEVFAPNKYKWECEQKRAEIYFLEAYKNLLTRNFKVLFLRLFQSVRVCRGFWIAPIKLLISKIFRLKL